MANIEITGTSVRATQMHALFDLDTDLRSKLDFSKLDHEKVKLLMKLEVLLLDEVSMRTMRTHNLHKQSLSHLK